MAQLNVAFFTTMHPSAAKRKLIFIKVPMQAAKLCAHNPKSIQTHTQAEVQSYFFRRTTTYCLPKTCVLLLLNLARQQRFQCYSYSGTRRYMNISYTEISTNSAASPALQNQLWRGKKLSEKEKKPLYIFHFKNSLLCCLAQIYQQNPPKMQ